MIGSESREWKGVAMALPVVGAPSGSVVWCLQRRLFLRELVVEPDLQVRALGLEFFVQMLSLSGPAPLQRASPPPTPPVSPRARC